MWLTVHKSWVPGHGVRNLPGLRLQLDNSRLGLMLGSSSGALETTQARLFQLASKLQELLLRFT